jgi:hypothetical protein
LETLGVYDQDFAPFAPLTTTPVVVPENNIVQFACVYDSDSQYNGTTGKYLITEQIYLLGDVFIRR